MSEELFLRRSQMSRTRTTRSWWLVAVAGSLLIGALLTLAGCEGLQKKFVRKPKPHVRETPIVTFQDYTRAMTPLDRYRKHYAIFDYWNAQLLQALAHRKPNESLNLKGVQKASAESLQELQVLHGMLPADVAETVDQIIEARVEIDTQLRQRTHTMSQLVIMRRTLERQTRQMHRDLYWRNVEDRLTIPSPDAGAD